jgi:hypothetical protein
MGHIKKDFKDRSLNDVDWINLAHVWKHGWPMSVMNEPLLHTYEITILFAVIEIRSVTSTQNCATIYNDTIIALFIDIILSIALWPWGRITL